MEVIKIPKIIHYCWFGPAKFSKVQLMCIETWKKYLKDYEFILWNEKNTDLSEPFLKFAYENGKWAFVADFVRLKVVSEFGGIYLDTDMFLLKNFDELLENECFFGAENETLISLGVFGAVKNNNFINGCLKYYQTDTPKDWQLNLAIPRVITRAFLSFNNIEATQFNELVILNGIVIYPQDFFYPLPFVVDRPFVHNFRDYKTKNTIAIHLWDGSWMRLSEFQLLRKRKYWEAIKVFRKQFVKSRNLNVKYYRKIIRAFIHSLKSVK